MRTVPAMKLHSRIAIRPMVVARADTTWPPERLAAGAGVPLAFCAPFAICPPLLPRFEGILLIGCVQLQNGTRPEREQGGGSVIETAKCRVG